MFLILMVVGLVGLAMMALPALSRHGGAGPAPGAHAGHAAVGHGGHGAPCGPRGGGMGQLARQAATARDAAVDAVAPGGMTQFLPSPRAVFSVIALYGAFANALEHAASLPPWMAALGAVLPALAVERFVVRPVWNLVFRFEGAPSAPLEAMLFGEAKAVTPFRNGKGVVAVVREGRLVQLAAQLREEQKRLAIKVGDRLLIEEVDAARERLVVSVPK